MMKRAREIYLGTVKWIKGNKNPNPPEPYGSKPRTVRLEIPFAPCGVAMCTVRYTIDTVRHPCPINGILGLLQQLRTMMRFSNDANFFTYKTYSSSPIKTDTVKQFQGAEKNLTRKKPKFIP